MDSLPLSHQRSPQTYFLCYFLSKGNPAWNFQTWARKDITECHLWPKWEMIFLFISWCYLFFERNILWSLLWVSLPCFPFFMVETSPGEHQLWLHVVNLLSPQFYKALWTEPEYFTKCFLAVWDCHKNKTCACTVFLSAFTLSPAGSCFIKDH